MTRKIVLLTPVMLGYEKSSVRVTGALHGPGGLHNSTDLKVVEFSNESCAILGIFRRITIFLLALRRQK